MVLILSDQFDAHTDVVISKLSKAGIPYFRFDLDVESLKKGYISFESGMWRIVCPAGTICSDEISCVWCRRPFVELTLEEQDCAEIDFKIWKNEWNKTLLGLYNSLKALPWLNPLRKAYKGENKYYQMELAHKAGLLMPDTLVSNEKRLLQDFIKSHHGAILKLMAQEIYTFGENDFRGFYTNRVNENSIMNFGEESENPVVLQEYIDKKFEVRYTVVGDSHFACQIDSQRSEQAKYDWRRYDIPHTPHIPIEPPREIKSKVTNMMRMLGLEFGALDFIVTPEDKWIFLEINCMGQWLWIEQLTGLPISDAIVEWIQRHIRNINKSWRGSDESICHTVP